MRHGALKDFTKRLAEALAGRQAGSHSLEFGHSFIEEELGPLREAFNRERPEEEDLPYLAALVCFSLFDIALNADSQSIQARQVVACRNVAALHSRRIPACGRDFITRHDFALFE